MEKTKQNKTKKGEDFENKGGKRKASKYSTFFLFFNLKIRKKGGVLLFLKMNKLWTDFSKIKKNVIHQLLFALLYYG